MNKQPVAVDQLALQPFTTFDPNGILLVCAHEGRANPMTISWGTFGIMWGMPVVMVMVRFSRFTYQLIQHAPDFTVNWLPGELTGALNLCGSASGRDMDKFSAAGISTAPGINVQSPHIAESIMTLECTTQYRDILKPEQFVTADALKMYRDGDFHELFFGRVVAAFACDC